MSRDQMTNLLGRILTGTMTYYGQVVDSGEELTEEELNDLEYLREQADNLCRKAHGESVQPHSFTPRWPTDGMTL